MKILNGIKRLSRYFFYISIAVLFAMMCFMTVDVLLQAFIGGGILGNYEIVELMMPCIIYFAFSYTQVKGGHIAVDLIKGNLSDLTQRILNFLIGILTLGAGVIMVCASWKNVLDVGRDGVETATLGIPLFPFYAVVCVGCVILAIAFAVNLIEKGIALFHRASDSNG